MKRISVTELFKCKRFEPFSWFSELGEAGKYYHELIQNELKKRYPDGEAEYKVEMPLEVDGEEVILVGKVDFVRWDEGIFYEIKPYTTRIPIEWAMQRWTYEWMLRATTGVWFKGYYLLYRRKTLKWHILRPLISNDNYIDYIVGVIRFKLKHKEDEPPVRGGLCRFCRLQEVCKTRFRFDRDRGVLEEPG